MSWDDWASISISSESVTKLLEGFSEAVLS